jgi:uncharacterized membrane protein
MGVLLHPPIVHFPLALWLTSALFDWLAWWWADPMFRRAAYWLVGLGLLAAMVSIAAGWIDLLRLEREGIGTALRHRHGLHSYLAYAATLAYTVNFAWRLRTQNAPAPGFLSWSVIGAALIGLAGYFGGVLRDVM